MTYQLVNLQYQNKFNHSTGSTAMLYLVMNKSWCAALCLALTSTSWLALICSSVKTVSL